MKTYEVLKKCVQPWLHQQAQIDIGLRSTLFPHSFQDLSQPIPRAKLSDPTPWHVSSLFFEILYLKFIVPKRKV